jgi:HTH-type transcriptional regulator / antitoxin HigA
MNYRVIKTDEDYEAALADAERLVAHDPSPGTASGDQLELLTVLIEDYEKRQFQFEVPSPISAIEFRMEEQGLRQKDLVPMLGSRSRVSEVLSGKRPLTVAMIRALSLGLGIPADILIGSNARSPETVGDLTENLEWSRFPLNEMQKRGWFDFARSTRRSSEELVQALFAQITSEPAFALYRRKFRGEGLSDESRYSVLAWTARVLIRAKSEAKSTPAFQASSITPEVLRQLVSLSNLEAGPRLAVEFLAKRGVTVIIEPRLPKTLVDGVALLTEQGQAVIGLTLRYDRLDAFWFTLIHEVIHVWKHLSSPDEAFIDRIERTESDDRREREANRMTRELLIPRGIWRRSRAFLAPSKESVQHLAQQLGISPAIVVGRLHFETGNYRSFNEFVGNGAVRKLFPEAVF